MRHQGQLRRHRTVPHQFLAGQPVCLRPQRRLPGFGRHVELSRIAGGVPPTAYPRRAVQRELHLVALARDQRAKRDSGSGQQHLLHAAPAEPTICRSARDNDSSTMVGSSTACSAAWTLGTILVIQSGSPSQIGNLTNPASDGYNTVNNNDAGVYFNGVTARQLQSAVGVFHTGNPWVLTVNPNLIAPSGTAASSLTPANIPGVWGYRPYLYGPHWFNDDLSLNKIVPIREHVHATFQAEFLNVNNHPRFNLGTLSVRSTAFGQQTATAAGSTPSAARRIELRANIGIVQARCRTVFLSTLK